MVFMIRTSLFDIRDSWPYRDTQLAPMGLMPQMGILPFSRIISCIKNYCRSRSSGRHSKGRESMATAPTDELITKIRGASRIVAFTGAGVSAESGVPTFRGPDGIWAKFKPQELANMEAFMRNPQLVWEWYAHRKKIISSVQPNAGHRALAILERYFPSFTVITQNIDNLHRRAGSRSIFELHGNIERNYCIRCHTNYADEDILGKKAPPKCARCGGLVRPDVVWFGEALPEDQWMGAVQAAETAQVFFCVGTSAEVYPAASLPFLAKGKGAFLIEINPNPTSVTERADEFLQGASGAILPLICERITGQKT